MKHDPRWTLLLLITALIACGGTDQKIQKQLPNSLFIFKANVKGLVGDLVLSNNGKNNIAIAKDGTTTFPISWNQDGIYEIKVMEEPCDQRCTIDQPRGQISTRGSVVLNIVCEAKRWDIPTSQDDSMSMSYSEASNPSLAMNRYGDTLLSWYQSDSYNQHLYQREFINRTWTHPNSIVDHYSIAGSDSVTMSLALDDQGDSSIAWQQLDGNGFRSNFIGNKIDSVWTFPTSAFNLGGLTASADTPLVRTNSLGEKIMVWSQTVGSVDKLFKVEFKNGQWTFPNDINARISVDGTTVGSYDVAINDIGEMIIVWNQKMDPSDPNSEYQLFKTMYRPATGWEPVTDLNSNFSPSGTSSLFPRVAINNLGDVYIVWHQYDSPTSSHYYKIYLSESHDHGNTWNNPSLSSALSVAGKHGVYARIAVNDQRKVVVGYSVKTLTSDPYQMYSRQKVAGGSWTSPQRLSVSDFATTQSRMVLDMDEVGNVIFAWTSGGNGAVYKAEQRNGIWVLADQASPINTESTIENSPSVVANNCRSTIAWQQENTVGQKQIYIRQYR